MASTTNRGESVTKQKKKSALPFATSTFLSNSSPKSNHSHHGSDDDGIVGEKDLAATLVGVADGRLREGGGGDEEDEEDVKRRERVLRKVDGYLMPWMWVGYGFVYYDKVSE